MILPAASLRLAGWIPRDAAEVLEFHGTAGSVAEVFRRWAPWSRFDARPLAAWRDMAAPGMPVDCVILDHGFTALEQPLEVLRLARRRLKPGAPVLAVLDGTAPELLRRMRALCVAAGLTPDLADRVTPPDGGAGFAVLRAVDAAWPLRRMLVQHMALRPTGGLTDKRVFEPADFLRTIPGVTCRVEIDASTAQPFDGDRILVVQRRVFARKDVADIRRTVQAGYLVVGEMDDHPSFWPGFAENDFISFRAAHALQTSTPVLAEALRPYNPELAVFANQMATLPPPPPRRDGPPTLFFGAFNREADWAPLMPALNRVLAEHGDGVRCLVVHDRGFFDALACPGKAFVDTAPYARYLELLGGCDIALLPLADTAFNRCKSDLKLIECAAHGVVPLASPVVYGGSLRDGDTGLSFASPEDFAAKLRRLLTAPEERAAIAARAHAWVRDDRLLARHFRARHAWYQDLARRRAALTDSLFARLDALPEG